MDICPRCGSGALVESLCGDEVSHYGRVDCGACGKFVRWLPKPDNLRQRRAAGHRGLVKRYGEGFCQLCLLGADEVSRELLGHHVREHRHGGDSSRENVWIVCASCHALIHHVRTYHGADRPPQDRGAE